MRSSIAPSSGVRVRGRGQRSAMLSLSGTLPAKLVDLGEKKMCTLPEAGFFLREHDHFFPAQLLVFASGWLDWLSGRTCAKRTRVVQMRVAASLRAKADEDKFDDAAACVELEGLLEKRCQCRSMQSFSSVSA